jgi:hypothetical protein
MKWCKLWESVYCKQNKNHKLSTKIAQKVMHHFLFSVKMYVRNVVLLSATRLNVRHSESTVAVSHKTGFYQ